MILAGAVLLAASQSEAAPSKRPATGTKAHRALAVPFIEDDYARALTAARAKNVPIFVEAWAPW
jgi:hypothetical protein